MTLSNAQTRDINVLLHPYTNPNVLKKTGALVLERGKGVRVFDSEGRDYIESMAGLWSTSLGWGNEELADTAAEQMRQLSYGHLFAGKSHEPAIALAEKLKDLSPFPVGKILFAASGSEANDTQIKLYWYAANARGQSQKKKIISRQRAYHGTTIASASLTGLAGNHKSFDLPFSFAIHADCPHHYRGAEAGESEEHYSERLARNLETIIQREDPATIAAMIVEPVMGAGGAILPPRGYFKAINNVLAQHTIPLISDEVITGFGRTGEWFGCTALGFTPNSMSIAKALSSSYLPISAVLVSPEMSEILEEEAGRIGTFGHGFTYGGHPVSAAVALKTIEIYERDNIIGHVRRVSPHFLKRLHKLADHPMVGEAQGMGLIGGIELVANKANKTQFDSARAVAPAIARFCEEERLISRPLLGDRMAFCPPLIITEQEIDDLFDRFERALAKGLAWAKAENLLQS